MADETYSLLHQILSAINSLAAGAYWSAFGPTTVQIGQTVTAGVTLFEPSGGIIPAVDITPGTYTIDRIRTGAVVHVIASTPSSKTDGSVFASYGFPLADGWAIGDLAIYTFSGIVITIAGVSTNLPPVQFWTRVTQEPDIDTMVNTIPDLPNMVYVDTVKGVAGTVWPTGSAGAPVSNLADALTIANNRNYSRIFLSDPDLAGFTLGSNLTRAMEFIGRGIENTGGLNLNGKAVSNSIFRNLSISGNPTTGIECYDCLVTGNIPANSTLFNCYQGFPFAPQGSLTAYNFIATGVMNAAAVGAGASIIIVGLKGGMGIVNLTAAASVTLYVVDGSVVTAQATCTAGTITVYGSALVTNSGTGAMVDKTINTEVEASLIATGGGSNATKTPLGSLVRWITDNLQAQAAAALAATAYTRQAGVVQALPKTIDLNQVAAAYTLFTGNAQVVELNELVIQMPVGTVGGNSTLANGTGTVTEAGSIGYGTLTIHITGAGTFTITLPPGVTGTLTSGTATISGSPQTLVPGVNNCSSGATTGTATLVLAATLTGIYIQTDDATPQPLITSVQGLVANLTSENQLTWQGTCRIEVGKHVKLTIVGGATGVAYVCMVDAYYKAVVSGGYLS